MMLFKKLFLGDKQVLPIVLQNIGNITATLTVTLSDHNAFEIFEPVEDVDDEEIASCISLVSLTLPEGTTKEIKVTFKPEEAIQYRSSLQLHIKDNQYEMTSIILVGEGYQNDIVISNMKRRATERFIEVELVTDGNEGK